MILTKFLDTAVIITQHIFEDEGIAVEQFITLDKDTVLRIAIDAYDLKTFTEVDLD